MWKILIADDEPKIRKGLRNVLERWNGNIEIVGEAEDGEIAVEIAREKKPDILLVDICMPFLDGLELIKEINDILSDYKIIIVSGHDEFEYAQKALQNKVFDYILKPVAGDKLIESVKSAIDELQDIRRQKNYFDWAGRQLTKSIPHLKEVFFNDYINGNLTDSEFKKQLDFLGIEFGSNNGMIVVKVEERLNIVDPQDEWDRYLLLFAVRNIIDELLEEWVPCSIFNDNKNNIVAIASIKSVSEWADIDVKIQSAIEKYLNHSVIVCQDKITDNMDSVQDVYKKLIAGINEKASNSPIVKLIKNYIEKNFHKSDLSLQDVSDEFNISPTYLSRLLKQEDGYSFIEYLTKVRVKTSIQYMNDPSMKLVDIAQRVGYSTQHYFSTAFKKVLGVSPNQYRKGLQ